MPAKWMKSNAWKKEKKYVLILQGLWLVQAASTESFLEPPKWMKKNSRRKKKKNGWRTQAVGTNTSKNIKVKEIINNKH